MKVSSDPVFQHVPCLSGTSNSVFNVMPVCGPKALDAAILAYPQSTALVVHGMFDMLASTRSLASCMKASGAQYLQPRIVARSSTPIVTTSGLQLVPHEHFDDVDFPSLICIPDLPLAEHAFVARTYEAEIEWLKKCSASGTTIAATCSGAKLLAAAGILNLPMVDMSGQLGRKTELHFLQSTQHHYTKTLPSGTTIVVARSGAWQDMMLLVIARILNAELAGKVAQNLTLNWDGDSALLSAGSRKMLSSDAVIKSCQSWIKANFSITHPVSKMCSRSGLSERQFKRRFAQATGMSPIEYVHTLRLEEATHYLETTQLPVADIAYEIGYEDPAFLRNLFKRRLGITPAEYRKRNRQLHSAGDI